MHSSFHGVGHSYVQKAFQQFGFPPPIPVPEQKDPDPDFSTVSCPNPEEGESVLVKDLLLLKVRGCVHRGAFGRLKTAGAWLKTPAAGAAFCPKLSNFSTLVTCSNADTERGKH